MKKKVMRNLYKCLRTSFLGFWICLKMREKKSVTPSLSNTYVTQKHKKSPQKPMQNWGDWHHETKKLWALDWKLNNLLSFSDLTLTYGEHHVKVCPCSPLWCINTPEAVLKFYINTYDTSIYSRLDTPVIAKLPQYRFFSNIYLVFIHITSQWQQVNFQQLWENVGFP